MSSVTTKHVKQLIERAEAGQILGEDLDAFLEDPTLWRKTDSDLAVPERDEQVWMRDVYRELGLEVEVPPVPKLTERQTKSLSRFGFRLFFVPAIGEDKYPASFVKPAWGKHLDVSQIERRPLPGKWVVVETIPKPDWSDPKGYGEDRLGASLKLERRFGVSWDDLHQGGILEKVAKVTGFPRKSVRLPTAEEWNFLANLWRAILSLRGEILPDLGSTDSWEWCLNAYGSDDRLFAGYREYGGLSDVDRDWHDYRLDGLGFRVLAVL